MRYRPIAERFAEKYQADPMTGCWNWTGATAGGPGNEYPVIGRERGDSRGKNIKAHRFAYEHFKGPIPEGMLVRHRCHNPLCVNPGHLLLGTHADNMRDMAEAGRRRGRNTGSALSGEQLVKMKGLLDAGSYQHEVADELGIDRTTVQRAIYRGDLAAAIESAPPRRRYLSEEDRKGVVSALRSGTTVSAAARQYQVDRKTIRNIAGRETGLPTQL